MGDAPEEDLVPFNQNNGIWNYINQLICDQTTVDVYSSKDQKIIGITDVLGRPSKVVKNKTLFYLYEDGSVEKKIIMD